MKERTISARQKFKGRLIAVDLLEVELENGRRARREIVRHPGAVAVLGRLPDGRFVFVRQFRKAIERVLLEIVAGTREPGESSVRCARREVREETGYTVRSIKLLGRIFTAPGFCGERIDIYQAKLSASNGGRRLDDDERLDLVLLDGNRVETLLAKGRINDAKTLAALMMFKAGRREKS